MSVRHALLLLSLLGGALGCSSTTPPRPEQRAARQAPSSAAATQACAATLVRELYAPDPNPTAPVSGPMPHELTDVGGTLYFREPAEQGGGLWRSDGTASGTVRFRSRPATLPVALGKAALFFEDRALWRTDASAAGATRVVDFGAEPRFASPGAQLALDGTLFVLATEESGRTALWRTDGTAAGTVFLGDFPSVGASPQSLVAVGKTLFFVVDNGGPGRALWRSDGTAAGTAPVVALPPGEAGTEVRDLVAVGGRLVFTAVDGDGIRGLWKSDGTVAGTGSFATFGPPIQAWDAADPSHLVAVGQTLYFSVRRGGGQALELWQTDGTADGTALVKVLSSSTPWQGSLELMTAAPLGQLLLFVVLDRSPASPATVSARLWRSDGTPDGTFVLADPVLTEPGAPGPTLLELNGAALFSARDPLSTPAAALKGQELWMTDGTRAGTALLQDLFPGPGSSYPQQLTRSGPRVFFVATDGRSGFNLWALSASCVAPLPPPPPDPSEPPALRCPADVSMEAQGAYGAYVVYPAAITSEDATVRYDHPSGNLFPLGPTPVTATASSAKGGSASCSFLVTVRDTTPPSLTCPPDQRVRGPRSGAVVDYPPALATDNASMPVVTYSVPPGSTFPRGTTQVTATAKDGGGNLASCTFSVTVAPRALGCETSPSEALGWLLVAIAPVALLRRRDRGSM